MTSNKEVNLLEKPLFLLSEDELEETFMKLINLLHLFPEEKDAAKYLLGGVLACWGRMLESRGCYDKLMTSYQTALDICNDHEAILTNLGAHLLRAGYVENATYYFQQALKINTNFLPAQRNLETIYNMLVERWHFRMLNDYVRNQSFREAILKKVKQGFKNVLDIGTGTGILSLFAVEAGAQNVYACDNSKTMIQISEKVLARNNATEKIKLLHMLSNDINIPNSIPNRVSLVITETVDAGLLGEDILQTLIYAWDYLLLPCSTDPLKLNSSNSNMEQQMGCVIPSSANVWIAPVECKHINLKYRTQRRCKDYDKKCTYDKSQSCHCCDCFDFITLNLFATDELKYDCLQLEKLPNGFRYLAKPAICLKVNFNDRNNLEQLINGKHTEETVMSCFESGQLDCFVMWFDLILDEDIVLSSAPEDKMNRAKCWEQAIFPLTRPVSVAKNEKLKLRVSCKGGEMTVSHSLYSSSCEDYQETDSTSDPGDAITDEFDKFATDLPVSACVVSYLNDRTWTAVLHNVFERYIEDGVTSGFNILDLSPFPVFGFACLVHEQKTTGQHHCILTCMVEEDKDQIALKSLALASGIKEEQLQIVSGEVEDVLDVSQKFDIILLHPVDASGKMNEKYITCLHLLRHMTSPGGCMLPREIKICCKIIYSSSLLEESEVLDKDRVCGYDIAPVINEYKVPEHIDFILSTTEHDSYTTELQTQSISMEQLAFSITRPLTFKLVTRIRKNGSINALPYWFKIKLTDSCSEVSTCHTDSFCNQSAILLEPLQVREGDVMYINLTCFAGLINASVTKN